jgi:hypothetical protein
MVSLGLHLIGARVHLARPSGARIYLASQGQVLEL